MFQTLNKIHVTLVCSAILVLVVVMFLLTKSPCDRLINTNVSSDGRRTRDALSIVDVCYKLVSNPEEFDCMVKALDNLAAEREWKYNQLVSSDARIKYLAEASNVMLPDDSIARLQAWHTDIELRRDTECRAKESTFYFGSGSATVVVACAVEYEANAIELLDYVYYKKIVDRGQYPRLESFEPTDKDVTVLVESNKTDTRHCYWEAAAYE